MDVKDEVIVKICVYIATEKYGISILHESNRMMNDNINENIFA